MTVKFYCSNCYTVTDHTMLKLNEFTYRYRCSRCHRVNG